jgi:DNA-binding MarR family transcriptional regulator
MSDLELHDTPALAILRRQPDLVGQFDQADIAAAQDVLRVSKKLLGAFSETFALRGLSPGRYAVLMALFARDVPLAPSEIAEQLGVTRATVTGLIGGLLGDGLVAYVSADADDRRRKAIALTAKGRRLLKEVVPEVFLQMAGLFAPLSGNERSRLLKLLNKVEAGLGCALSPQPGKEG